jgi:hypothetical protein
MKKEPNNPISIDGNQSDYCEDTKTEHESETEEKTSTQTIPENRKKCSAAFRQQFSTDDGQYACPDCKKIFLNFTSLRQHMRRHVKRFVCDVCGSSLACQTSLRVCLLKGFQNLQSRDRFSDFS